MAKPRRVYIGRDRSLLNLTRNALGKVVSAWSLRWNIKLPTGKKFTDRQIADMEAMIGTIDGIKDVTM